MKLIDSKTFSNLARAYAGETQAMTRYRFVEYGARNEGYNALAEVIDKVVYNEFNHARVLYTFIQQASNKTIENIEICAGYPFKEKWDLEQNLKLAAEDEESEVKTYRVFEKPLAKRALKKSQTHSKCSRTWSIVTNLCLRTCTTSLRTIRCTKRKNP